MVRGGSKKHGFADALKNPVPVAGDAAVTGKVLDEPVQEAVQEAVLEPVQAPSQASKQASRRASKGSSTRSSKGARATSSAPAEESEWITRERKKRKLKVLRKETDPDLEKIGMNMRVPQYVRDAVNMISDDLGEKQQSVILTKALTDFFIVNKPSTLQDCYDARADELGTQERRDFFAERHTLLADEEPEM